MSDFFLLPSDEVLATLNTDAQRGLTDSDAKARLQRWGRNELAEQKPDSAWKKFLAQVREPLVIVL